MVADVEPGGQLLMLHEFGSVVTSDGGNVGACYLLARGTLPRINFADSQLLVVVGT